MVLPPEVDIIFAGGGTAACVAAGRLAASNPGLEVLLIEQGPNNLNEPTVITPSLYLSHMTPTSKTALFWQGNESKALGGRSPIVGTGGMLGGGSSINFMMYVRASASDLDDWETPGWSAAELLPLMRKMETYHVAAGKDTHGYSGPLHISHANSFEKPAKQYLEVAKQRGIPFFEDMDLTTGHGSQRGPKWVDPVTGHRQDAAHRYIHTQPDNKSLHIATKTKVARVLFDGTKAIGVEVVANKQQDPEADQTSRIITARKLVVVSAGAIGSPLLLQRSGIGAVDRLAKLGVPTVADLPGVGATYQDHVKLSSTYHASEDINIADPSSEPSVDKREELPLEFAQGKGGLISKLVDAASKIRPTGEELEQIGPEFRKVWDTFYASKPDKPVMLQVVIGGPGPATSPSDDQREIRFVNYSTYPVSRGHVYITSTDPYAAPDFETGFLDKQADVDIHVWAYKQAREIARRMPCYRGEVAQLHPSFPEGSAAGPVRLDKQLNATGLADLVYTVEDNAAIESFTRQFCDTVFHPCGTVPMKSQEQGGCIDARLNVHGTQNLKVADLSILPGNVGANTNWTAMLIGEKAATLIAEDLGLKPE